MDTADVRRVLVVAYYFPPMGLSGVQRTLKFVRHLPHFNWLPTVLTVDPVGYFAQDTTLLGELSAPGITVVRTPPAGPGRFFRRKDVVRLPAEGMRKFLSRMSDTFFIPDNKIGWRRKAVRVAEELHRRKPFDLIFATAPPFTDFLIGAAIKELINKPLVFDYRDPWVDYPFKFYPTPLHKAVTIALERKALRASSHVVTTNRRVKELLIRRYGFLTHHDIDIIPQGFDPADFEEATPLVGPRRPADGRMRITYAGIFWEDRIPDHFLRGLRALFDSRPETNGRIEARFVGHFRGENLALVRALGLTDAVTILDYLPHRECVAELLASDALWMIVGDDLGSPGKLYEYIGARKPILGLVPEGFIRGTIIEAGGLVVPPKDVAGITSALSTLFDRFSGGTMPSPPHSVVEKFDRRTLTGNLVRVFESLFEP